MGGSSINKVTLRAEADKQFEIIVDSHGSAKVRLITVLINICDLLDQIQLVGTRENIDLSVVLCLKMGWNWQVIHPVGMAM